MKDKGETGVPLLGGGDTTVSGKKDIHIYSNMTKNPDSKQIYRRGNKECHPKK